MVKTFRPGNVNCSDNWRCPCLKTRNLRAARFRSTTCNSWQKCSVTFSACPSTQLERLLTRVDPNFRTYKWCRLRTQTFQSTILWASSSIHLDLLAANKTLRPYPKSMKSLPIANSATTSSRVWWKRTSWGLHSSSSAAMMTIWRIAVLRCRLIRAPRWCNVCLSLLVERIPRHLRTAKPLTRRCSVSCLICKNH